MKSKLILRTMGLLILMASLFVFSSCSKTADGNLTEKEQQDKNLEASSIDEKDFTESDEDLTTVDYKEFYDQLSPHGEWVQVQPEEIGLQPKTALLKNNNSFSLSSLLGIKDVYAGTEVDVNLVYVWKPSADLGVTMSAGEAPVYMPYSNGQWVNSDAGWYFKGATPVEETVSHYGRWVNSPTAGWLWVPGRVWAPAWVDWKQNDRYVSWAPLPPSVYLVNGIMSAPVINENNYVIVERRYFLEPAVYKYNNVYYDDGNRILIRELNGTDGIIIVNNTIINRGPDVNIIQSIYGRNIELVKIQQVRNFNDVRYSDRDYYVYNPGFKRYKNKENKKFTINEPKSFKKYDEWKVRKSEEKESKKEEKEIRKENKGNNGNKQDFNSNSKKNNDNDKVTKDNSSIKGRDGKDKGNKQGFNDNGKKNNGNDKGNKNNGSNKGGDGNNKGKGKK